MKSMVMSVVRVFNLRPLTLIDVLTKFHCCISNNLDHVPFSNFSQSLNLKVIKMIEIEM